MSNEVGLVNRFAACVYEFLSLIALWLFCTAVFIMLFGSVETNVKRFFLQIMLWLITGAYFTRCWITTGQTLAAQAWKIKVVGQRNQPLTISLAILRYLLATVSLMVFGVGFLWALIDKDRLFLHDRVLKTRLIKVSKNRH